MNILYVSSDNLLTLNTLTDDLTGLLISNATVSTTITDPDDNLVATLSLTPTSTPGQYQAQLAHSVVLVAGAQYTLTTTVTSSSNQLVLVDLCLAQYAS